MGFDAQVARLAHQAPGNLRGLGRYLWAVAQALRDLEQRRATVYADGRLVFDGPALLIAVMNGTRYGGGFRIAPQAHPADGLFDVVIARELRRAQVAAVLPRVIAGLHLNHPAVLHLRAREVQVLWEAPVDAHVDGEMAAASDRFHARILPGALRLRGAGPLR
nr:hypothetical protein [Deinobacterium chartae]